MERRVIQVNEENCTGCGQCVPACPNAAIGMLNGKAILLRDEYCDGLGQCIPACPVDAIYFFIREAQPYNAQAAARHVAEERPEIHRAVRHRPVRVQHGTGAADLAHANTQWPVQLALVPEDAAFLDNAELLISADCAPFVHESFRKDFGEGKVVLAACPKLHRDDYDRILRDLLRRHEIKSITLVRMEEPCCSGLEYAVNKALEESEKQIPLEVITIKTSGGIESRTGA